LSNHPSITALPGGLDVPPPPMPHATTAAPSLDTLVAALEKVLAQSNGRTQLTPHQIFSEQVYALKGQRPPEPWKAVVTREECISPTGARFTAELQTCPEFPQGRVTSLLDYERPEDADAKIPRSKGRTVGTGSG
jgi:hypothetical protein